jgi:hypothetical protein
MAPERVAVTHVTSRSDFIMQNHFKKKWASGVYSKHKKLKRKKRNVTYLSNHYTV